jgi:hypothetical protein
MSARFATNFVVLLLGSALLILLFSLGRPVADWVALGAGAGAIVMALFSFAMPAQGVAQRLADPAIATVGAWAIVAARVMNERSIWLIFSAGAGLLGLGAIGLLVREIELARGLQIGETKIGPDEFAQLSSIQREAEAAR